MAYFPIYRYNVYDDPGRRYFGDQLDFFDPWSDLRSSSPTTVVLVPPNFRWVNQPQQRRPSAGLTQQTDKQQQRPSIRAPHLEKYRVQYNVAGFNPETIKTRVEGQKVVIEAKQEDRLPDGDYNIREVRKSCPLPEHADTSRLVSYVTPNHILVIEVPIKNPEIERRHSETKPESQNVAQFGEHRDPLFNYGAFLSGSSFEPKIVTTSDNKKQLSMSLEMKNFAPDEIKVSVKNNELIVKGEHRNQDDKYSGRTFFFKSVALPPGTRVEQLQSYLTAEGQLKIEVPYEDQKSETTPAQEQKSESEKTDEKTDS